MLYLHFMLNRIRQVLVVSIAIFFGGLTYLQTCLLGVDFLGLPPLSNMSGADHLFFQQQHLLFNTQVILVICHGLATFVAIATAYLFSRSESGLGNVYIALALLLSAIISHEIQLGMPFGFWIIDLLVSGAVGFGIVYLLKWSKL